MRGLLVLITLALSLAARASLDERARLLSELHTSWGRSLEIHWRRSPSSGISILPGPDACAWGATTALACLADRITDQQVQRLHDLLSPIQTQFRAAEARAIANDPVLDRLYVRVTVSENTLYVSLCVQDRPTLWGSSSERPIGRVPHEHVGRSTLPAENAGAELVRMASTARVGGPERGVARMSDAVSLAFTSIVPAGLAERFLRGTYRQAFLTEPAQIVGQTFLKGAIRFARVAFNGSVVGVLALSADGVYMFITDDAEGLLGRAWNLAVWTASLPTARAATLVDYYKTEGFPDFMALSPQQRAFYEAIDPDLALLRRVHEDFERRFLSERVQR